MTVVRLDEVVKRVETLEAELAKQEAQLEPIIQTLNAGKLLGKILFVLGGIVLGVASLWGALSGWIGAHLK